MRRVGRLRGLAPALLAVVLAALVATGSPLVTAQASTTAEGPTRTVEAQVEVGAEPDGTPVTLDTTTFLPGASTPGAGTGTRPAVLLSHGFGGTKADVVEQAEDFAERGFIVLTYTARGFGDSGGRIHLADPAYEGADQRVLLDRLAGVEGVLLDAPNDPRVGVVGASYGGALALMAGALDQRVDTVVAAITWNDLGDAFFPQNALSDRPPALDSPADVPRAALPGPFKQLWSSRFFLSTAASGAAGASGTAAASETGAASEAGDPVCGRFDAEVCRLFLAAAETGTPSDELLDLLAAHSPAPLLADLRAPTYLVQGMADSLFGVEQADATARTLLAQDTPVAVRWMDGGHDAVSTTAEDDAASVGTWLEHYLDLDGEDAGGDELPLPAFVYAEPLAPGAGTARLAAVDRYLEAAEWSPVDVVDAGRPVLNPPGGQPASLTVVPGSVAVAADAFSGAVSTYPLAALPGQSAAFDTPELGATRTFVGTPRVRLQVTSSGTSSTLFLSLWQVTGASATLTRQVVSPFTVATEPGRPTEVEVALPGGTWRVEAGGSLRVLVTATDQTYAGPRTARVDLVRLADLRLPEVDATALPGAQGSGLDTESAGVLAAIGVLGLLLLGSALLRRRRRRQTPVREDLRGVPLVVDSLVKTYSDGHRAVDDVSWRADRGQVVGLLGPNGAGKTTTLRMVMGLIRPDSGTAHVLGEVVGPGSPVLARVGALIEGPGFLPHLTGRQNLEAYWAATGRAADEAGYEDVLDVAALGGAVDRPVRTYSQGMRQRLGIAQAMLGLPEVLVLDEPTNGLDPPQIAGLRPILHRYAAAGRTVVVSSHLLSEVELTCSHVVVMHAGRVVTTGTVAELVDSADTTVVSLAATTTGTGTGTSPSTALADLVARLRVVPGLTRVEVDDDPDDPAGPRLVITAELARADVVRAVADAGADIVGVSSRRQLEEVFLGVIAAASGAAEGSENGEGDASSMTERLRQVRSR